MSGLFGGYGENKGMNQKRNLLAERFGIIVVGPLQSRAQWFDGQCTQIIVVGEDFQDLFAKLDISWADHEFDIFDEPSTMFG